MTVLTRIRRGSVHRADAVGYRRAGSSIRLEEVVPQHVVVAVKVAPLSGGRKGLVAGGLRRCRTRRGSGGQRIIGDGVKELVGAAQLTNGRGVSGVRRTCIIKPRLHDEASSSSQLRRVNSP